MANQLDPLRSNATPTQYLGWGLYVAIALVSIWATGQSISRSFDIPIGLAYFIGLIISSSLAALISVLKNSYDDDRSSRSIIVIFLVFLLLWGISLITNTHQFFLVGSYDEILEGELADARTQIVKITDNGTADFDAALLSYENKAKGMANSISDEIINAGDPGLGKAARYYMSQLEQHLGIPAMNEQDGTGTSARAIRNLAKRQRDIAMQHIKLKMKSLEEPRDEVNNYLSRINSKGMIAEIDQAISALQSAEYKVKPTLAVVTKSHGFYENAYNFLYERARLIPEFSMDEFKQSFAPTFPDEPVAMQLQHIDRSWSYVRNNWDTNFSKFFFAFMIAVAVDVAGFIILYFVALPPKRKTYF